MADDDSSELSSLSSLSPAPSDDESDVELKPQNGILKFFHKLPKQATQPASEMSSPPPAKREPSPPHEYILADNPDIAFIVEFRKRFDQHLGKTPNFGPIELEQDVVTSTPGDRLEHFLCTLLRMLLNRKQDVKPGHYKSALEETITKYVKEWPRRWEGKSPLSGGVTFVSMTPEERLSLLRQLVLWALERSDQIHSIFDIASKKNRDRIKEYNVEPIGSDGDKRRYFLVQGLDDASFRVYRESNPAGVNRTWWSVAGSIDEVKALAEKLEATDRGPKARGLAKELLKKIPEFEEAEEKRKRREYRRMQKERFKRPEPGFSLYEGRTRGKRVKYTYSDDEDFLTDSTGTRRSTRNTRNHTPSEPAGPIITASGRQSRRPNRLTAETLSSGAPSAPSSVQGDQHVDSAADTDMNDESSVGPTGRPRRSAAVNHGHNGWMIKKTRDEYIPDDEDDEDDESEPDLGDDEEDEHVPEDSEEDAEEFDEEDLEANEEVELDEPPRRHIVKLRLKSKMDDEGKAETALPSKLRLTLNTEDSGNAETTENSNDSAYREEISTGTPDSLPFPPSSARSGLETGPTGVSAGITERTEDVVNVVVKGRTPEPQSNPETAVNTESGADPELSAETQPASVQPETPLTPSGNAATSLAFRGSPEKPQPTPQPINV